MGSEEVPSAQNVPEMGDALCSYPRFSFLFLGSSMFFCYWCLSDCNFRLPFPWMILQQPQTCSLFSTDCAIPTQHAVQRCKQSALYGTRWSAISHRAGVK